MRQNFQTWVKNVTDVLAPSPINWQTVLRPWTGWSWTAWEEERWKGVTQEGDAGNVLSGQSADICSNTAKGRVKLVSIYGSTALFRLPYSNIYPAESRSCVLFGKLSVPNSVYYIICSLQSWPLMESGTHLHSTLNIWNVFPCSSTQSSSNPSQLSHIAYLVLPKVTGWQFVWQLHFCCIRQSHEGLLSIHFNR